MTTRVWASPWKHMSDVRYFLRSRHSQQQHIKMNVNQECVEVVLVHNLSIHFPQRRSFSVSKCCWICSKGLACRVNDPICYSLHDAINLSIYGEGGCRADIVLRIYCFRQWSRRIQFLDAIFTRPPHQSYSYQGSTINNNQSVNRFIV